MDLGWIELAVSTVLILVALGMSLWSRLGVGRSIIWAAARAAVQLLAVGLLFRLIFESTVAMTWAWLWVAGMTVVSAEVVTRRAPPVPALRLGVYGSLVGALAVSLAVTFWLGVFELEPVTLVVIAGITLGNTMPSAVLAVDTAAKAFTDSPGRIEAALALGMDVRQVSRIVTPQAVRTALIPQIERTKVVGLVAIPGAMTGMLLAGADALASVMVQLVIMYLILGAVAIATVTVVTSIGVSAFTEDGRLQSWTGTPRT